MRPLFLALLAASALLAEGAGSGIPPRPHAADYQVQRTLSGLTLAATVLTPAETRKAFTAGLDRAGFLIFEVAAYPAAGARIDISPDQFTLPIPGGFRLATSSPGAVVEMMTENSLLPPRGRGRGQAQSPTTIYGTGRGGRRGGAPAVVADPDAPPPPRKSQLDLDPDNVEMELARLEFPSAAAGRPVAGYLYFQRPRFKPKNGVWELMFNWTGVVGREIVLPVPFKK
jgi:hypothetical protein